MKAKLVRDKIPDLMRADGATPNVASVGNRSLAWSFLFLKLHEEIHEYVAGLGSEELVDVYEVVRALWMLDGNDIASLEIKAEEKRKTRGGFDKLIVLNFEE